MSIVAVRTTADIVGRDVDEQQDCVGALVLTIQRLHGNGVSPLPRPAYSIAFRHRTGQAACHRGLRPLEFVGHDHIGEIEALR